MNFRNLDIRIGTLITRTVLLFGLLTVSASSAAASITGTVTLIGGSYSLNGGSGFSDAAGITFDSPEIGAFSATDALGTTVGLGTLGSVKGFDFDPLAGSIIDFIEIGGWSFQLDSAVAATPRSDSQLFISGTGILTGNGYDATAAQWTFSSNNLNDYSMTLTAVPVPAAVWLFVSGLLGLAGIARRRR